MADHEAAFRISSGTSASTDSTRSSLTAKPSTPTTATAEAASRTAPPAHIDTEASTPQHHK
jgi:adenylate cyclase